jgi:CIC family chloride channel protein
VTSDLHEGPEDSVKKYHAGLSEQLLTTDMWTDILRKTLVVGIISFSVWIGCALLRYLVGVATGWLFETAEKYSAVNDFLGVWFIVTVMCLVGLVRGLLMLRPAWKDAEGDGVDKTLVRFHQTYEGDEDDPKARYAEPTFFGAIRKMVMTVLTIGGGGSGGLEGPGVYLGETLAAGWSKVFNRPSADELRLYQLSGVAAAIGTLLEAPFMAALFAAELVYAGRIIYRKLAYCLIAGVLAYTFNNHLLNVGGLFETPEHARMFVWQECFLVLIVAVGFSAPAAIALGPIFRAAEGIFTRLPTVLRAVIGSLITGAIGVLMWSLFDLHPKHILGVGEETINDVVKGTGPAILQIWWILLLAVVAKTLATASTIKSGGSAGMLIPSMYMGGLAGAAGYYVLGEMGLYAGPTVAVFVATGMAAALTSVAGVPLASIAFVIEVFGSEYTPAAAIACAVCFTASRRFSLYVQPNTSGDDT